MTDHDDPTTDDGFVADLAAALHRSVDGEHAPAGLVDIARQRVEGADRAGHQRRLAVGAGAGLLGAAAALVVAVVLGGWGQDDDGDELRTTHDPTTTTVGDGDGGPTTTKVPRPTGTTVEPVVVDPEPEADPPPEEDPDPDPEPPADPGEYETLEPACVEGGGGPAVEPPAEWNANWTTPLEPNDPVTLLLCIDDMHPAVGQTVTLTLVADDPDAEFRGSRCKYYFWWETDDLGRCLGSPAWGGALAPGAPPTQPAPTGLPGHLEASETYVYETPGARSAGANVVTFQPGPGIGGGGGATPYESSAEAYIDIVVHE